MSKVINYLRHAPQFKLFSGIKWSESYTSLLLGLGVVILAGILVMSLSVNRKSSVELTKEISSDKTQKTVDVKASVNTKLYTVMAGESLWSISEKIYNSGFRWVEIAKANNISSPDVIEAGMSLKLPKVDNNLKTEISNSVSNSATTTDDQVIKETNKITDDKYTVKKGEYLWDIALRAYGDGFRWVDIAKANNIANPDFVFSGDVLKIPR